jgi:hypothetical protein
MIVLPDTDTSVWDGMSPRRNGIIAGNELRVGGTQIDSDGFVGHYSKVFVGESRLG